jgi:alkylhydroperoxidase family enzyme|tara:strand:- start:406 stop:657 length:252 start_codon:yes stop_codon:yes gene_type:complete
MARIPIIDENDPAIPAKTREALQNAGKARGRLINVYRAMANRPEALAALTGLIQTVYRGDSTVSPQQGELAYMTATAVNDCFY